MSTNLLGQSEPKEWNLELGVVAHVCVVGQEAEVSLSYKKRGEMQC